MEINKGTHKKKERKEDGETWKCKERKKKMERLRIIERHTQRKKDRDKKVMERFKGVKKETKREKQRKTNIIGEKQRKAKRDIERDGDKEIERWRWR